MFSIVNSNEQPENETSTGTFRSNRLPEEIVQYYAAALATCTSPTDLVNLLLDMLESDGVDYIEKNSDRLYLLGSLWLNAVDRIIFSKGNAQFPYELLILPPIFHQMGWRYDMQKEWVAIRDIFRIPPDDSTVSSTEFEQAIIVGAFLDGIFSTPEDALRKIATDYSWLFNNPKFCVSLVSAVSLLGHFGWYMQNSQSKP